MNYVQFDEDDPVVLCSGSSLTLLREWVEANLPNSMYLRNFVDKGTTKDTLALRNELAEGLDAQGHLLDDATKHVAEHLLESIGVGDSDETATVIS